MPSSHSRICVAATAVIIAGAALPASAGVNVPATFGSNLIINGDGESSGATTSKYSKELTHWRITSGNASVRTFRTSTQSADATYGRNIIMLNTTPERSTIEQTIDVSSLASTIENGDVAFSLSGRLIARLHTKSVIALSMIAFDADGNTLSVADAQKDPTTSTQHWHIHDRTTTGVLDSQTRSIKIVLDYDASGSTQVAYADNLSFSMTASPTPGSALAFTGVLAVCSRRRRHTSDH